MFNVRSVCDQATLLIECVKKRGGGGCVSSQMECCVGKMKMYNEVRKMDVNCYGQGNLLLLNLH